MFVINLKSVSGTYERKKTKIRIKDEIFIDVLLMLLLRLLLLQLLSLHLLLLLLFVLNKYFKMLIIYAISLNRFE